MFKINENGRLVVFRKREERNCLVQEKRVETERERHGVEEEKKGSSRSLDAYVFKFKFTKIVNQFFVPLYVSVTVGKNYYP